MECASRRTPKGFFTVCGRIHFVLVMTIMTVLRSYRDLRRDMEREEKLASKRNRYLRETQEQKRPRNPNLESSRTRSRKIYSLCSNKSDLLNADF
ncbi:hypothetical protein J437_LFUL013652 [Ladona fulva]|uniref:Uncharacterized protein n=1 Tax=Ladona fulva TaxID=123851 RepID=A0A8K0KFE6_LADFU|nr:hypothetical protein J437_LFUL013652 [Ladona fulva]